MNKSVLNSSWMDRANIPLLDGIFDDNLSEEELIEIRSYAKDCLDTEEC